jgi:hypothetical protein
MINALADVNVNWHLVPLILAVSLVYSATRYESWRLILQHAIIWVVYIVVFLAATYGVLYLVAVDASPFIYVPVMVAVVALFFWTGKPKHPHEEQSSS